METDVLTYNALIRARDTGRHGDRRAHLQGLDQRLQDRWRHCLVTDVLTSNAWISACETDQYGDRRAHIRRLDRRLRDTHL